MRAATMRQGLALTALLVACLLVPAAATGQPAPALPGTETARFRLIVEGTSNAITDHDLAADPGVCAVQVNVHVGETATYQRGRGVVVEFVRFGQGSRRFVLMRRPGRNAGVAFNAVVTVTRTSKGFATRTETGPPGTCPPLTEDLSQGPDCGRPDRQNMTMALTYVRGALRLRLAGLGAVPDIQCPVSQVLGGVPDLLFGWPTPAALPTRPLPRGLIFGTRRVIVVRTFAPAPRKVQPVASGPLSGSATHFGRNRATIRLIRIG